MLSSSIPGFWPSAHRRGLWPGGSGRLSSPQEGVGLGALPAPLTPAARQREEPPEIPLAAAQSPPEPAWRHQGEPNLCGHGSGLAGWQRAPLSPAARGLLLLLLKFPWMGDKSRGDSQAAACSPESTSES